MPGNVLVAAVLVTEPGEVGALAARAACPASCSATWSGFARPIGRNTAVGRRPSSDVAERLGDLLGLGSLVPVADTGGRRSRARPGSAPSTAIAARSSSRRSATTSSPARKPPSASHSVGGSGYAAGRPPNAVTTVEPGCANSMCAAPSAASSKWGEHTTTRSRQPLGKHSPGDLGRGDRHAPMLRLTVASRLVAGGIHMRLRRLARRRIPGRARRLREQQQERIGGQSHDHDGRRSGRDARHRRDRHDDEDRRLAHRLRLHQDRSPTTSASTSRRTTKRSSTTSTRTRAASPAARSSPYYNTSARSSRSRRSRAARKFTEDDKVFAVIGNRVRPGGRRAGVPRQEAQDAARQLRGHAGDHGQVAARA